MTSEQKATFRKKMESYRYLLYNVKDLKEQIDELYRKMSGLKGISYEKIPSMPNPEASERYKLAIIDDIAAIEKELRIHKMKLSYLEQILKLIPDPESQMFILKYRDRKTYEQIGRIFGYSPSGIFMKMDKALDNFEYFEKERC